MSCLKTPIYYDTQIRSVLIHDVYSPKMTNFILRAAGGLGPPPSPSPWRMLRSYDDADILRHADHSVLIHDAPRTNNKCGTLPRPKVRIRSCQKMDLDPVSENRIRFRFPLLWSRWIRIPRTYCMSRKFRLNIIRSQSKIVLDHMNSIG